MINCAGESRTAAGASLLRPVRAGARRHLFLAGKPGGVRRPRLPRLLDGVLRRSVRPAGHRADGRRDGAVLQLRAEQGREGAARRVEDRAARLRFTRPRGLGRRRIATVWPDRRRRTTRSRAGRQGRAQRTARWQAAVRRQCGAAMADRTAGRAVARGHVASRTARRRTRRRVSGVGSVRTRVQRATRRGGSGSARDDHARPRLRRRPVAPLSGPTCPTRIAGQCWCADGCGPRIQTTDRGHHRRVGAERIGRP